MWPVVSPEAALSLFFISSVWCASCFWRIFSDWKNIWTERTPRAVTPLLLIVSLDGFTGLLWFILGQFICSVASATVCQPCSWNDWNDRCPIENPEFQACFLQLIIIMINIDNIDWYMRMGENVEDLSIDFTLSLKYPDYPHLQNHHRGIHQKNSE